VSTTNEPAPSASETRTGRKGYATVAFS
jgi:hypothetical protein